MKYTVPYGSEPISCHFSHILRQFCPDTKLFSGKRLKKSAVSGMKCCPPHTSVCSVQRVSQKRMPQRCHMHSDLMGTACLQMQTYQRPVMLLLHDLIMGDSVQSYRLFL